MNLLNHEFELIGEDSNANYICAKCGCDIDMFGYKTERRAMMWDKLIGWHVELITCDEFIIKNIIE